MKNKRKPTQQEIEKGTFLFPEILEEEIDKQTNLVQTKSSNYNEFVDKFKPKLTTDDCFTPPAVYDVVLNHVYDKFPQVKKLKLVRPFYPGGDYTMVDYKNSVVIDNPPFSILAEIKRFYIEHEVPFFLFAPALTLFTSKTDGNITYIVTSAKVVYDNGANVNTSFVTNLYGPGVEFVIDGRLRNEIEKANKSTNKVLKYKYPDNVVSPALMQKYARNEDLYIEVRDNQCHRVTRLDAQRQFGKAIFGGGYLISDSILRQIKLSQAQMREREEELGDNIDFDAVWELSKTEKEIIKNLK